MGTRTAIVKVFAGAVLVALVAVFSVWGMSAGERLGVVLMHGKGGGPRGAIAALAKGLESAGYLVSFPTMPWSEFRKFDRGFDSSLIEIDGMVAELRKKGATRIVVGGHSIGANVAIGYGAGRDGIAGILAIAPGHVPRLWAKRGLFDASLAKARAMIAAGEGDTTAQFDDSNQGTRLTVETSPRIYLSFWDPEGPLVMQKNVSRLRAGTALLWIIGKRDRMYKRGRKWAYSKAPSHPKNAYVVVKGGHRATPETGMDDIIAWLNRL
jgi:pimeloyl-ACP methyl ester carboxylesterase